MMYTLPFKSISNNDISKVGGKNASLGEMYNQLSANGIEVPDGFATTATGFRLFLSENKLEPILKQLLDKLDTKAFTNLDEISVAAKKLMLEAKMPVALEQEIVQRYEDLCKNNNHEVDVAVRSSATAEDLPTASFAGQHESFLYVSGSKNVVLSIQKCFASLFTGRAIQYRCLHGFDHLKVALSAGIQLMVQSDKACSGVCFTLDPESGFRDSIVINGCWGLGENIVLGTVTPDEFHVFKPSLKKNKKAILSKKCGSKLKTLVTVKKNGVTELFNADTSEKLQREFVLSNEEIEQLARWAMTIEKHYKCPMDIEWAKDGLNNRLYIIQARPETVHTQKQPFRITEYRLKQKATPMLSGAAVGNGIASGIARILHSPSEAGKLREGEILITDVTNPDWDPIMKKAAAIITNHGGRTSHAAIVAREQGAVAVIGTGNATEKIKEGQYITVSTAQGKTGHIYEGKIDWEQKSIDMEKVPVPETAPMLILGDPDKAYNLSWYPNKGVGLLRLEFIINNSIRIHPMALVNYEKLENGEVKNQIASLTAHYSNKQDYFTEQLSMAVATIAAAFYPKDVIVRMSDFKTNEYANLIGGKEFEPAEENPMIGFRGASRYYHPLYRDGFKLECKAMKIVRDEMGLTNVKLMIPFCRTPEEGKKVVDLMAECGLERGRNGLELYVMAEIPSNIILANEFAGLFDGFSIGSNDLTQLTLGIDRDSNLLSDLFDENNAAVKKLIIQLIQAAHLNGRKVGLCGQAPSDNPEFASFLVEQGIDSISFNPDALLKGMENMIKAELHLAHKYGIENV